MGRLVLIVLVNLGAYRVLRRLWPSLGGGWRRGFYVGLSVAAVAAWGLPLALGLGPHGVVPWVGGPLKLFASGWVVAGMLVMVLGLPVVVLHGLVAQRGRERRLDAKLEVLAGEPVRGPAEIGGVDMQRRNLLAGVGRAVPLLAVGASTSGVVGGSAGFQVRHEEMRLRGLPAGLDGFRVGQITDVHVGPFVDAAYVRRAVEAMNEAQVDLQVLTGDLIDDLEQLEETMEALGRCQARHGMLAVLGNHEHWRGLGRIRAAYADLERRGGPVKLLVDTSHVLEHREERVRVVGVDYPMVRMRGGKQERMKRSAEVAFREVQEGEVVVCLTHHPDFFPLAAERGARLTLAGHTHGGQVALLGIPLFGFVFEHMLGRYRRGDSHLYVSGGTGHWLPFRVGVPAEVTVLTLRAV